MHVQVEKIMLSRYIIFTNQNKYSVQDNRFWMYEKSYTFKKSDTYLGEIQYSWENISNVSM